MRSSGVTNFFIDFPSSLVSRAMHPPVRANETAEALAELGRYEEARTCLTAAAEEFPGDPDMTDLLVRIRDQENQRKLAEAEGELGEGIHWGSGRP